MAETLPPVELILLDSDDFMHPVESAANFNESAYYNFFDAKRAAGGWVRIGNRPNEGYAEVTICLYEPDGTASFMFERPQIADSRAHASGGLRFEVVVPWREHRIAYEGTVCFLKQPLEMAEPSVAFKKNPHVPATIDVTWRGLHQPAWGGEPRRRYPDGRVEPASLGAPSRQFARGHFEQHGACRGSISIAGSRYEIDGFGLRDHSWGPRYWQNTGYYRWLTLNFGPDLGLMGLVSETPGGEVSRGYVYERGQPLRQIEKVELHTDWVSEQKVQGAIRAKLHPAGGGAPYEITGRVLSLVPCRNRRAGWVTRISEGMTEWKLGDRVGTGMSEYLDHLERGEG